MHCGRWRASPKAKKQKQKNSGTTSQVIIKNFYVKNKFMILSTLLLYSGHIRSQTVCISMLTPPRNRARQAHTCPTFFLLPSAGRKQVHRQHVEHSKIVLYFVLPSFETAATENRPVTQRNTSGMYLPAIHTHIHKK